MNEATRVPEFESSRGGAVWRDAPAPSEQIVDRTRGLDRSARLPKLIDTSARLGDILPSLVIAVVGAGSIGMRVVDALARMGIAGILICDSRATKRESVLTHPIQPQDIGVSKAELSARRAQAISPATRVRFFDGAFESLPYDALIGVSLVVVASDNLAAEVAVSQACLHLDLPLIQASVFGPALVSQVRSLEGGLRGQGPCLVCGYSVAEFEALDSGTRFSCEGASLEKSAHAPDPASVPTTSPPHLCSSASDLAVSALLKRLVGFGPSSKGSEIIDACGFTSITTRSPLGRDPLCPLDHAAWDVRSVATPLEGFTPRSLFRIASHEDCELDALSLQVEGHRFAVLMACDCSPHPRLGRFLRDGEQLGPCAFCGGMHAAPHPMYSFRDVPCRALEDDLDRTLSSLGVTSLRAVLVRGQRGTTLLRAPISKTLGPVQCEGGAEVASRHKSQQKDLRR